MRFGMKGKWSLRYVGPYKILQGASKAPYKLRLSSYLALLYFVFPVSMLKKCIGDPEPILPIEGIDVDKNISYEAFSVEILYLKVNELRNK